MNDVHSIAHRAAAITSLDKFHVMRVIGDAVDKTRLAERAEYPELKGYRYALLRNPESMSDRELDFTSQLLRKSTSKTARMNRRISQAVAVRFT